MEISRSRSSSVARDHQKLSSPQPSSVRDSRTGEAIEKYSAEHSYRCYVRVYNVHDME